MNRKPRSAAKKKSVVNSVRTQARASVARTERTPAPRRDERVQIILATFRAFGIEIMHTHTYESPSASTFELTLASATRVQRLKQFEDDLSHALRVAGVEIQLPSKTSFWITVRVPKDTKRDVYSWGALMREHLRERPVTGAVACRVPIGAPEVGTVIDEDLDASGHLLVVGLPGTGKTSFLNSVIASLIARTPPADLQLILDGGSRGAFVHFAGAEHLAVPPIRDTKKSLLALKWLKKEMDRRFELLEAAQVHDRAHYLAAPAVPNVLRTPMPRIVFVMDDILACVRSYPKEFEEFVQPVLWMSRAVGIHLIVAASGVDEKFLPQFLSFNCAARVTFRLKNAEESNLLLDTGGAEMLRTAGNGLYQHVVSAFHPVRFQAAYISEEEIRALVGAHRARTDDLAGLIPVERFWKEIPNSIFEEEVEFDELYERAKQTVRDAGKASTSFLQRKLGIGYSRAARLMDMLERRGVFGVGGVKRIKPSDEEDEE